MAATSSALIREENGVQRPVYYTSQAFQVAKGKYMKMEKMSLSLVIASGKLRPYFQAHTIMVMIDQPIKKAMNKLDTTSCLIQYAIKLNQFDIKYKTRTTIKAQILLTS